MAVALLLVITALFLLLLNPPQKCVQVSVSVRQWQPVKRTRVVQGLDENIIPSDSGSQYLVSVPKADSSDVVVNSAWFRTKIILPSNDDEIEEEAEDETGDELDEYSLTNDNYNRDEYYDDIPENKIFENGDFDYNDTSKYGSKYLEPDFGVILRIFNSFKNNSLNSTAKALSFKSSQLNKSRPLQFKNYKKSTKHRWRNITLVNIEGVPIVEDGIFWSDELEKRAPKGKCLFVLFHLVSYIYVVS